MFNVQRYNVLTLNVKNATLYIENVNVLKMKTSQSSEHKFVQLTPISGGWRMWYFLLSPYILVIICFFVHSY